MICECMNLKRVEWTQTTIEKGWVDIYFIENLLFSEHYDYIFRAFFQSLSFFFCSTSKSSYTYTSLTYETNISYANFILLLMHEKKRWLIDFIIS